MLLELAFFLSPDELLQSLDKGQGAVNLHLVMLTCPNVIEDTITEYQILLVHIVLCDF